MNRLAHIVGCAALALIVGCGSSMEDPISNEDGCRRLNEALATVCTGSEAVQWLNCDVLPGCPAGTVEGQDVESCALKIEGSTSCGAAKNLECTIDKLDCGSAATSFTAPIGTATACDSLLAALGDKCTDAQESDCDLFVKCPGGAVESADVLSCVSDIGNTPTCEEARLLTCTIEAKYCAP